MNEVFYPLEAPHPICGGQAKSFQIFFNEDGEIMVAGTCAQCGEKYSSNFTLIGLAVRAHDISLDQESEPDDSLATSTTANKLPC